VCIAFGFEIPSGAREPYSRDALQEPVIINNGEPKT
jgi:hypothetical protein